MAKAFSKIKDLADKIEVLLEKYPTYRDNDKKLVCHIWMEQMGGIDPMKQISLYDFLKTWIDSKNLANPDTICRARRKVQEVKPHLRGAQYKHRRTEEVDVRSKINTI
jgi:hypothetical protein